MPFCSARSELKCTSHSPPFSKEIGARLALLPHCMPFASAFVVGAESEAYSVLFALLFFSKVYVFALVLFKNLLVHSLGCATVDNHFARFACALRTFWGRRRGGVVELANGLAHRFDDTPKR